MRIRFVFPERCKKCVFPKQKKQESIELKWILITCSQWRSSSAITYKIDPIFGCEYLSFVGIGPVWWHIILLIDHGYCDSKISSPVSYSLNDFKKSLSFSFLQYLKTLIFQVPIVNEYMVILILSNLKYCPVLNKWF